MAAAQEKRTQKRSIAFPIDMLEQLDKLAVRQRTTTSDLVRGYVDKGLAIDGHKENIDLIAAIIRQEIKSQLDIQIERLAKMNMKIGKISAGLYYLVMKLLLKQYGSTRSQSLKELATETRKMGVKYMQMKDYQINDYLEDDDMIMTDADKL
ncbi:hypothetical protein [Desulfosporosinus lacus]|uniref:Ribbon-helix-helix protein, copG family n=1 Tax=Desulfosporosinus lacus DSM 15449 TaxID=1121420 RepID=A0A1M5V0F7_9FIRM|nr:hypothetical protein [Desulfosporosinus lacus]SHH68742.1 hypothetical protein SAMN02746098_01147 [Desulfosporosinus lacus DSM 15449]